MLVVDPAAREYLATLAAHSRDILERDLIGVYAAGSLALEGYQPGRSDIDVAVVVSGPLSAPAKQALVDGLRHETVPCPARGLELVAYRTEVAAAGAGEPGFEVELNFGAAMPSGHLDRAGATGGGREVLVCHRSQHPRRTGFDGVRTGRGDDLPSGAR